MSTFFGVDWEKKLVLPNIYKEFYEICSGYTPDNLVGTDLLNTHPEGLHIHAEELLEEDGVENFLEENDLVFMMHQGYMFWYFKADGNPDPEVFYYHEGRKVSENCGPFSIFIKEFIMSQQQPTPTTSATPKKRVAWWRIIAWVLLLAFIAIQFFQPDKNNNSTALDNDITTVVSVPPSVQSSLQAACYDCHSNNTQYPWYTNIQPVGWWLANHIADGKRHLNFNEFATYSAEKRKEKLDEIAGSVRDGWMPLDSYTWVHKEAKLSNTQKEEIIAWVNNSKRALSSAP